MGIQGLRSEAATALSNDALVRLESRSTPFYVVFHGSEEFQHEHYGIHLGQEDHLTFLGSSQQRFWGHFLDCRANSPTFGVRQSLRLSPSLGVTLVIPAGVGHAFQGLQGVFTVNSYTLLLPKQSELLSRMDWNIGNDVINIPLDCPPDEVPRLTPNEYVASPLFYEVLATSHREDLRHTTKSYPVVQDVTTSDRGSVRLKFVASRESRSTGANTAAWNDALQTAGETPGVAWHKHLVVSSGKGSGVYVVPEFGDLALVRGPCHSIRAASRSSLNASIAATFVSSADIPIGLTLRCAGGRDVVERNIDVPVGGEYEIRLEAENDVSIARGDVFAIVRHTVLASALGGPTTY